MSKNNPKLANNDLVRIRRSKLAQTGDSIKTISSPLQGVVTTYSLFKILSE